MRGVVVYLNCKTSFFSKQNIFLINIHVFLVVFYIVLRDFMHSLSNAENV